jgi:HEPN domain-containing protein
MNELYKEWIKKAEEDIETVEILLAQRSFSCSVVCFHCQQGAEKHLKAFLTAVSFEFPKIHDLNALLINYCIPFNQRFEEIKESSMILADYAITTRYPDFLYQPSIKEAVEAHKNLLIIKDFILENLAQI